MSISSWTSDRFQPALRLVGGGDGRLDLRGAVLEVSTRPPPRRRRGPWPLEETRTSSTFQPALRLVGGGDQSRARSRALSRGFNPPSASSAEGTRGARALRRRVRVSTRPPPRRRRGHVVEELGLGREVPTRPPPRRRRGRARWSRDASPREVSTRPPPRRRRGRRAMGRARHRRVSTRPPPRRRRGRTTPIRSAGTTCFNPPSASSAEGTVGVDDVGPVEDVSTRPPPRRRRGPVSDYLVHVLEWFQPALRLVGGGDLARDVVDPEHDVSTRPPPRRRRGPARRCRCRTRRGGFNPPSASSAEGT